MLPVAGVSGTLSEVLPILQLPTPPPPPSLPCPSPTSIFPPLLHSQFVFSPSSTSPALLLIILYLSSSCFFFISQFSLQRFVNTSAQGIVHAKTGVTSCISAHSAQLVPHIVAPAHFSESALILSFRYDDWSEQLVRYADLALLVPSKPENCVKSNPSCAFHPDTNGQATCCTTHFPPPYSPSSGAQHGRW
jgi:hypothetical protein